MEHSVLKAGKRSGWSDRESNLLWETADEAQQQGLPLKQVFERIAEQTGRRPNSIRNYYYAQVRQRAGDRAHTARFVPFANQEVTDLMYQVLRSRAQGQSVRSCLQQMAGGDHSLMLRFQNKYRSVLKSRPELVKQITERLNSEGIACQPPEVRPRSHGTLPDACVQLNLSAQRTGDTELMRACDTLSRLMLAGRMDAPAEPDRVTRLDRLGVRIDLYRLALTERTRRLKFLNEAACELVAPIKEFLGKDDGSRVQCMNEFVRSLTERIGTLETRITEAEAAEGDEVGVPL